jgi:rhodanese-related sulfurtransferase
MKKIAHYLVSIMMVLLASQTFAGEVSPMTVNGATTVDTAQAKALFDKGALFVDVRSDKDWAAGRIPDAIHLELKKVFSEETLGKDAKKDDAIVIYCNGESCLRSSEASVKAVGWGFTKIQYYRDGFPAWKAAGYPTE